MGEWVGVDDPVKAFEDLGEAIRTLQRIAYIYRPNLSTVTGFDRPIEAWTANQVVAWNLRRAREWAGLTQEQAAELLEPHLGAKWSKATWSAAERSITGKRIRQFSADELVAFADAFGLPIEWFFDREGGRWPSV